MPKTLSRSSRVLLIAVAIFAAIAGNAWARTGYDANPKSVVFYFGETAGSGHSQNFAGYDNVKLCTDGDNTGGGNSYGAQYYHNRGGLPDEKLYDYNVSYGQGAFAGPSFSTSSGANYHTHAGWSGVPSAPDSASGFVASRTASLSCP